MTRTANEMLKAVGTHVYLEALKGLRVRCRIANVKTAYGRNRYEIEPITGEGKAWVNAESVSPCYEAGLAAPQREDR